MLELNAYAEEIVALATAPKPIRLLYSPASAIQDVEYSDTQLVTYEALYFLGVPIGFVTENMLRAGLPQDCRWLIVPNAGYVSDQTAAALDGVRPAEPPTPFRGADKAQASTCNRYSPPFASSDRTRTTTHESDSLLKSRAFARAQAQRDFCQQT